MVRQHSRELNSEREADVERIRRRELQRPIHCCKFENGGVVCLILLITCREGESEGAGAVWTAERCTESKRALVRAVFNVCNLIKHLDVYSSTYIDGDLINTLDWGGCRLAIRTVEDDEIVRATKASVICLDRKNLLV